MLSFYGIFCNSGLKGLWVKKLIQIFVYLLFKRHGRRSLIHDYQQLYAQELKSFFCRDEIWSDVFEILKATEEDVDRQVESDLVSVLKDFQVQKVKSKLESDLVRIKLDLSCIKQKWFEKCVWAKEGFKKWIKLSKFKTTVKMNATLVGNVKSAPSEVRRSLGKKVSALLNILKKKKLY